jgi:hypothetical protein
MTVFEWQARVTERSAKSLAHYVETTSADRLDWAPVMDNSTDTRSVFELVFECCRLNRRIAGVLKGSSSAPSDSTHHYRTAREAVDDILSSATELAAAIRGLSEECVEKTYTTGLGPVPGAILLEMPASNMQYHSGQINLIQLLYGDPEFHIPPDFTTF